MKKKDLKYKHLIYYMVAIQKFRNPSFDKKLNLTRILFQTKQYKLAISDLKRHLNISFVKVSIKKKLSMENKTGGYIEIPVHLFGTPAALKHDYNIFINPTVFTNFDLFVRVLVHELCHLKLFLSQTAVHYPNKGRIYLWDNEKAVDTLAILSGFGDSYARLAPYSDFSHPKYISRDEFYFLYRCFTQNREFKRKSNNKAQVEKKPPWYKNFFKKIFQS